MATQAFEVQVQGLDKLMLKLGHVTDPVEETLHQAGEYAQQELRVFAKPHPGDKGTIGTHSRLEFGGTGVESFARLVPAASMTAVARVIEEGRKPGKGPPAKAMKAFAASHGIYGDKGLAWRLRGGIKARGTKGVHMFAQTGEATEKKMDGLLKKATTTIEKAWAK